MASLCPYELNIVIPKLFQGYFYYLHTIETSKCYYFEVPVYIIFFGSFLMGALQHLTVDDQQDMKDVSW